jgi:large subunit ribosomal protein L4
LPADIFEIEVNVGLMHQAYLRQMANARSGSHSTKTRGEVQGSTAKIYRQKGTGRARHGARTAPIFVGGGLAFGPKPRDYSQKMPKKMRQKAIRCALSALVRDEQLILVETFSFDKPKTADMKRALQAIAGSEKVLVVMADKNENVKRSLQNLPKAHSILANYLNIRDLLQYDKVIMSLDALEIVNNIWGQESA